MVAPTASTKSILTYQIDLIFVSRRWRLSCECRDVTRQTMIKVPYLDCRLIKRQQCRWEKYFPNSNSNVLTTLQVSPSEGVWAGDRAAVPDSHQDGLHRQSAGKLPGHQEESSPHSPETETCRGLSTVSSRSFQSGERGGGLCNRCLMFEEIKIMVRHCRKCFVC